ncbi:MAG: six-hairpin glycosidase [Chitinophagaceae bacterium]|nr:six-hairpin glycosidase [Chitinophagaceae bacterium]
MLRLFPVNKWIYYLTAALFFASNVAGQTGTASEPVRYVGGVSIDPHVHEGRLRWAIGTESIQVMRANRAHTDIATDSGWTYNHAPDLAYWNGRFYLQYLSNPADEHIAPGQTLLVTSADGRNWNTPQILFAPYQAPAGVQIPEGYQGYMMHQRMGFYVAPNDRLLTLAFYGHAEDPFQEGGIGRMVREIYKDGSMGPVYFIKYETHSGWNESNTSFPFYTRSKDTGFVNACNTLLNNRLKTLQWKDEDDDNDPLYAENRNDDHLSALSFFHRKDGKLVMLWKKSKAALSEDEGIHFSPVKVPTLIMSGGKNWGQKTDDGRYAMVYNPIESSEYRYPLITVTSDDGILFDDMLLVQGEVPPRRFYGRWKDFGPCYTRGISEDNGNPPGSDMWVTYSMNKEDMWISRVPVPVRYGVHSPVHDHFNQLVPGQSIPGWNTYAPKWAPVSIAGFPSTHNKSLCLSDEDPYDYARAIRVFKETTRGNIQFKICPAQNTGELSVDITDRYGNRPVRICFNNKGEITAQDGARLHVLKNYQANTWYDLSIQVNATLKGTFDLFINKEKVMTKAALAEAVQSVERISFRTGAYRNLPERTTPNETPEPPLPGADEKVPKAVFYIDDVTVK